MVTAEASAATQEGREGREVVEVVTFFQSLDHHR